MAIRPHTMRTGAGVDSRVSTLEGEFEQFVDTFQGFVQRSEASDQAIFRKIDDLANKLNEKTTPNMQTFALWASVVIAVIFGVAAPMMLSMSSSAERDRHDSDERISALDSAMQKDFAMLLTANNEAHATLNASSKERYDAAVELFHVNQAAIEEIRQNGTPAIRERMARLEATAMQTAEAVKLAADANLFGSPVIRERIAALEGRLSEHQTPK